MAEALGPLRDRLDRATGRRPDLRLVTPPQPEPAPILPESNIKPSYIPSGRQIEFALIAIALQGKNQIYNEEGILRGIPEHLRDRSDPKLLEKIWEDLIHKDL